MKHYFIDLVAVHSALEPNEKRHIRLQLEDAGEGGRDLLLLFSELGAVENRPEKQVMQHAGSKWGWSATTIASLRRRLVQFIQASLAQLQQQNDPVLEIYDLLRQARVLRNKAFVPQALQRLEKAAKLAKEYEELELLAHVRHQHGVLLADAATVNLAAELELSSDSDQDLVQEIAASFQLRHVIHQLGTQLRERPSEADALETLATMETLCGHHLRASSPGFRSRGYALLLSGAIHSIRGQKAQSFATRLALHDHYQSKPALLNHWLGQYSGNLYNIVGTLVSLDRYQEAEQYLAELRCLPETYSSHPNKNILRFLAARTLNLEMLLWMQSNQHLKGISCYKTAMASMRESSLEGLQEYHLGVHLAAAILYLELGQSREARGIARRVLEVYPAELRKDLRLILKVVEIFALVQADEGEYISYKASNLERSLSGATGQRKYWLDVVRTLRKLYSLAAHGDQIRIWRQFLDRQPHDKNGNLLVPKGEVLMPRVKRWTELLFPQLIGVWPTAYAPDDEA
ncbi:MAG TPA: hypothetical protein VHS96_04715 [Bacteroidia bacterium]|nr:hypothetical protein [Bacteroidia bacterium]